MPLQTSPSWVQRIKSIKANNPTWGAGRILGTLEQEAVRTDVAYTGPSEPTIRRILRREWDPMTERDQRRYLYFYWPESMQRGDLPWEASAAAIEMLRWEARAGEKDLQPMFLQPGPFKVRPLWQYQRPSIDSVYWYWRVTQVMPLPPEGTTRQELYSFRFLLATFLSANAQFQLTDEELIRDLEEAVVWETVAIENLEKLMEHLKTPQQHRASIARGKDTVTTKNKIGQARK